MSGEQAGDSRFFVAAAAWMTAVVVVGFGSWGLRGMVDYGALPALVHVHALVFAGWMALFVGQSVFASRGSTERHRVLGWIGAGLAVAVFTMGVIATADSVRRGAFPPFFAAGDFLIMSFLQLAAFATLFVAAVALRRRSDWHRRLMLAATAVLTEAAFGRLLPLPLFGAWMYWALACGGLLFVAAGMIHDVRTRGGVHAAYFAGLGAFVLSVVLIHPIADSSAGAMLLSRIQG